MWDLISSGTIPARYLKDIYVHNSARLLMVFSPKAVRFVSSSSSGRYR